MTAGAPRSARWIDPANREAAEDLARRSGLSLNEWLTRLMAEQGPEDATSQDYFSQGVPSQGVPSQGAAYGASPSADRGRYEAASHPADELDRAARALERLSDRIESAESRQALAIAGVERSVREVISRIDAAEREQMQAAARFEGTVQDVQGEQGKLAERVRRIEQEAQNPRSIEALRSLEGALGKVAGRLYESERRAREAMTEIGAAVERIDQTEQLTAHAIHDLRGSCSALDERLGVLESGASEGIERLAQDLASRVEATREELTNRLAATAEARFDRVEQALAEMNEHVRTAEQRSASALERMGREVLEVAQSLNRRVQGVETRSAETADRMGADVARIASAVEGRLAHADLVQAQALEKLGGEIARITERLADRIASAERRSAQAIDDVGEQVARVTERIGQRHERATSDLAERIRSSEERTARLLEEARQKIDARLAEVQARAPPPAPAPAPEPAQEAMEDALFSPAPFPAYETPAERPYVRPAPMSVYARFLRPAPAEPPSFEAEDFDAVARLEPLAPAEATAPAAQAEPAPEELAGSAKAPTPAEAAFADLEFESVELEPNVGFDMDEPPTALESAAEPEADAAHESHDERHELTVDFDEDPLAALEAAPPTGAEAEASFLEDEPGTDAHDALFAAEPETAASQVPSEPVTTRDVIDRARAAAQASSARQRAVLSRMAARPINENVLDDLSFGRSRKRPASPSNALMVAGVMAAVSLAAGGFVVLEGQPQGKLPKRVADALALGRTPAAPAAAPATPLAAVALAPKPDPVAAPSQPDLAGAFAVAAAKASAGAPGGVDGVRKLAEQGYAPAAFFLSKLYDDGKDGLPKDPVQARVWTQRAAEGGDRAAMHNLALDYFEGVGGARSAAAAAEWFRRAADLGLLDSQFNLAGLYEHGQGVSQNSAEAYKWYLIAARSGDAESRANALRIRAGLTAEARVIAERAAAAFAPAPAATPAAAPASPDLVTAQKALNQLGYYQGPTDGLASPALRLAIAAYQRDQSLPVSGAPDAGTIAKLSVYTR